MISNHFPVDRQIFHSIQLLRGQYLMPNLVICFSIKCGYQANIVLQTHLGAMRAVFLNFVTNTNKTGIIKVYKY